MRLEDMCEMTTTVIASAGAGAVTMTAISNIPTFTDLLTSANSDVRYVIEDTTTGEYEIGLGRVSSLVLTRTLPQETRTSGGTVTVLAPSALTFSGGATPTSGNIRIRMSPVSADKGAVMTARQSTIAGDSTWRDYMLTEGYPFYGNGTGSTLTADSEYYIPYELRTGGVLAGVQFEVTTGVGASNMKMAFYNQGSDGLPGTKIVDFTTTATVTATVKTDTSFTKQKVNPGFFWIGFLPSHAVGIRIAATSNLIGSTPLGRKNGYGYGNYCLIAGSYATGLPAIPSLGSATMGDPGAKGLPWFGLKVTPS